MVDRLDEGLIPPSCGASTYSLLHDLVARAIFRTHVEGKLKAEIIRDPARFVGALPALAAASDPVSEPMLVRQRMCVQCGIQTYAGLFWISVRRCASASVQAKCRFVLLCSSQLLDKMNSGAMQGVNKALTFLSKPVSMVQGKTLLLITNSDFNYTDKLMRYTFDPYLPEAFGWRDLFDMVRTATRFDIHHDWSTCPIIQCRG
jgi:hypothetical protein